MMACTDEAPPGQATSDADARFAAYRADLAAHVDDPHGGEEYRAILAEDPETQRAWFEVIEDMLAAPVPPYASLVWMTLLVAATVTVFGLVLHAVGLHL